AVDVALRIDGDAFGRARAGEIRTASRFRIGDVPGDLAVLDAAPADAALPAVVILRDRFRFGVRDVQNVVLDEDPARPAELTELLDELAVLIEDLHPVVVAIADEQPSPRVERQRVRLIELARTGAQLAPLLDELASLVELQDAIVSGAVPLGDEDVPVECDDDVVRLIEIVGRRGAARLAEREQHLAVRAELEHLVAVRCAGPRADRARGRRRAPAAGRAARRPSCRATTGAAAARRNRRIVLTVGHPEVAV